MKIWTRRDFNRGVAGSLCVLSIGPKLLAEEKTSASRFVHPGMLHGAADIERIKLAQAQRQEPIYSGFQVLRDNPLSQFTYLIRGPFSEAGRGPGKTIHIHEFDGDARACYQCALMGSITGDDRYFAVSRRILNAWSGTLKTIVGVDAVLGCGLGGFLYLNGAELLRSTGHATSEEMVAWKRMFREVFLPVIIEFAPFANGNWDTAALKTVMAIGIFCDDAALFDHAVQYYLYGCGDGRLTNYIYPNGQCQESGRDQAHTQLGEGHMGDCCEMAWQQGLNLYGAQANRLLCGFEYTACYELGGFVPFIPDKDRTGKYFHNAISIRHAKIQPIYEQIYNHYSNRMGLPAPYTQRAAKSVRPDGSDGAAHTDSGTLTLSESSRTSADHPGFGTLAYSRNPGSGEERAPAEASVFRLRARGSEHSVVIEWLALHGEETYAVRRAHNGSGPFHTIASNLSIAKWRDQNVIPSQTYFYRILREPTGRISLTKAACAGLPSRWKLNEVGTAEVTPTAFYDGEAFILEAAGIQQSMEGGVFVSHPWQSASAITARLVPRIASQQLRVGLMVRDADTSEAMMLFLSPDSVTIEEYPAWSVRMEPPATGGSDQRMRPRILLDAPVLQNGRVQGGLWFRLERKDRMLHGSISTDGYTWQSVHKAQVDWLTDSSLVGLALSSGLGIVTTEVLMDRVTFT
jgi:Alginate lyase